MGRLTGFSVFGPEATLAGNASPSAPAFFIRYSTSAASSASVTPARASPIVADIASSVTAAARRSMSCSNELLIRRSRSYSARTSAGSTLRSPSKIAAFSR